MEKLLEKYPRSRKCLFCGNIMYLEPVMTLAANSIGKYFCPVCRFSFIANMNPDEIATRAIEYYEVLKRRYNEHMTLAKNYKTLMNKASEELRKIPLARRL